MPTPISPPIRPDANEDRGCIGCAPNPGEGAVVPGCVMVRCMGCAVVGAVRVVGGAELLDLAYVEDKDAEVDFNVVMTGRGQFVEVQGSGEEATFSPTQLSSLVALAQGGLKEITALQASFLAQRLL